MCVLRAGAGRDKTFFFLLQDDEEVVYIKVFDKYNGDVVFEGKVSTEVSPHELVYFSSEVLVSSPTKQQTSEKRVSKDWKKMLSWLF